MHLAAGQDRSYQARLVVNYAVGRGYITHYLWTVSIFGRFLSGTTLSTPIISVHDCFLTAIASVNTKIC